MKKNVILSAMTLSLGMLAGFSQSAKAQDASVLQIKKQGVFSSGGRVTAPLPGEYDATRIGLTLSARARRRMLTTPTRSIKFPPTVTAFLLFSSTVTDRPGRAGRPRPTDGRDGRTYFFARVIPCFLLTSHGVELRPLLRG